MWRLAGNATEKKDPFIDSDPGRELHGTGIPVFLSGGEVRLDKRFQMPV